MHRLIAEAFEELGLPYRLVAAVGPIVKHGDVLCFQQHTPGDLLYGSHKVVGSAQRRHRQHLMQHGGVLLARSEYALALPGILELAGIAISPTQAGAAILKVLRRDTGWDLVNGEWTSRELDLIDELVRVKYGSPTWNRKR
jgi:lipoyl(octanoyl) transferase